jgi:hypothetical protein
MTQRQVFKLIKNYGAFEVREFAPCVLAEVTVQGSLSQASSQAFGALFNYIAKGNVDAKKIAMTAPVTATTSGDTSSQSWVVSFVMPAELEINNLPLPSNASVKLRSVPAEECAVLSFRGRADLEKWREKELELRRCAVKEDIKLTDEVRISRFDPPFKPGLLHYNEIAIPLATSTH